MSPRSRSQERLGVNRHHDIFDKIERPKRPAFHATERIEPLPVLVVNIPFFIYALKLDLSLRLVAVWMGSSVKHRNSKFSTLKNACF